MTQFRSIAYAVENRTATLTLNRPDRFNAIDEHMPGEIAQAVALADADPDVHVILVRGAGPGFCGGYDLVDYAEAKGSVVGSQDMPWDPTIDFAMMWKNTQDFMSLWRSRKPTIACVHGSAVAGGSDIALCCDFLIMTDQARIGYPPARVWGVPTPAMWVYRLGPQAAKRMMMTGDLIQGPEAKAMGLALDAAPASAAPVLGWKLGGGNSEAKVLNVHDGGPAQAAGVAAGDVLVALDGLKVSAAKGLDDMLARRQAGDEVTLHVFRRDELMSLRLVLAEPVADKFTVKRSDRAGADALKLRKGWLGA